MAREIVKVPNPILHEVSKPVESIDSYIKELVADMLGIVEEKEKLRAIGLAAAGLAAVQLGELVRVIVVMYNMYSPAFRQPVLIINPEIVKRSKKTTESRGGCLSIGDGKQIFAVKRYKQVKVVGIDLDGERVVYKGRDLLGFALQHEIDHLDGKLISDK